MRSAAVVLVILVVAFAQWTKCDDVENAGKSDEADGDDGRNATRPAVGGGLARRGTASTRDSQLLSVLAARRRQLLTDRVGAHLATIATFANRPEKHNITSAHLEIRDANNTLIKRISLADNRSASGESKGQTPKLPFKIEVAKLTPDSRSSEVKSLLSPKSLQDAKVVRAGFLSRRKPASEVVRFAQGTKKPLIDLSVVSHETLGIPEKEKALEDIEAIVDPDEEFQVDESNHGIYLYNYTTNATSIYNDTSKDVEILNVTLTTKPSLVDDVNLKLDTKIILDVKNASANDTKAVNENKNDEVTTTTTKASKVETPNKENENNTLFLTDELYNHFRPLESELPVEDMAPFLFFGQKITINIPKENITQLQLTPTKPTYHIRTQDKKRGSYRPVTEKTNTSDEDEDEINENMDVSVVKNVIEKNKIRNTVKQQAPARHGNLVNAYRKQVNSTSDSIKTENSTKIDDVIEPNESVKDEITNRNFSRAANRTYYNFRRKPAKLVSLSTTEKDATVVTTPTPPLSSTVVYTAVVTSVSITSSVKAQNKTDTKNETIAQVPATNDTAKSANDDLTTVETVNAVYEKANNVSDASRYLDGKKKNETTVNKKKPDVRQRVSTIRPRVRFTPQSKLGYEGSSPTPPFLLYANRTASRLPQSNKFKITTTTERSFRADIFLTNANSTENQNARVPKITTTMPKFVFSSTTTEKQNITTLQNNYYYAHSSPTVVNVTTANVTNDSEEVTETTKMATTVDQKSVKEILERRNNEVLIEIEKTNMTTYVLAGLGFLPLTIIVMFVLRHLFLKKAKEVDTDYEGYFQDDVKKETQITTVARPPNPPPKKPDEKWEFPRNKLRLQTLLGQGNFGQVWKAEADDLTGHDGLTRLVAVKTIKESATQKEKHELLHEICIMQKIGTHPNIVTLLACCTEQEPYLLIMEYVMCGKLLTYLRDRRSRVDRFQMPRGGLTSRDLTVFAYCVARGMDYLASKGIVHRDLAARNVLVDHNKLCKIADFGMSRDVTSTSDDKFNKPQRNALPVRWMAPEALLYSVYSHETDVWAYGVLLWEIVTLGSTPYATMSGREVLHMVTEGYRLERPAHCKPHLYQTMHACWHADPAQRPPFSEIKKQLSELLENEPTEGNYVDLESFYQDSSVYSDPSAIIENDGGISIEYSDELGSKLSNDGIPRRSFHIPNATNLQRKFSGGNSANKSSNFRNDNFNTVRAGNHTSVGGFGIMDGGFSGRDGNFCERNNLDKLSGTSFHRERETNKENVHSGNGLISRNSFNGVSNQSSWSTLSAGRPFLIKSGSSRSKRISEFECNI